MLLEHLGSMHWFECFNEYFAFSPYDLGLYKFDRRSWEVLSSSVRGGQVTDKEKLNSALARFAELLSDQQVWVDKRLVRKGNAIRPNSFTLCLFVTHDCNFSCDYCFDRVARRKFGDLTLSLDNARSAINDVSKLYSNILVWFFGGEPLTRFETIKKIVEYCEDVRYTSSISFNYCITTNGALLNREVMDFFEDYEFSVMISTDNECKAIIEDSKRDLNGLTLAVNRQHALNSLSVRTTITNKYIHTIRDTFWELRKKGVKTIFLCPAFGERLEEQIDVEDACAWVRQLRRICWEVLSSGDPDDLGAFAQLREFFVYLDSGRPKELSCGAGKTMLAVDVDGNRYPCQRYLSAGMHRLENGDFELHCDSECNEQCAQCWAYPLCGGNFCSYHSEIWYGNRSIPFAPLCIIQKKLIELSCWAYAKYGVRVKPC